eukprot:318312-Pyramimonas_sp.AAC.1
MECFYCEAHGIQEDDQRRVKGRDEACQFQEKEVRESGQRRVHYGNRKINWWSRLATALGIYAQWKLRRRGGRQLLQLEECCRRLAMEGVSPAGRAA